MLPQLASNIASNAGIGPTKLAPSTSDSGCRGSCDAPKGGPSPVRVWPLIWGDADSGADILSRFAAEFGGRNCDLILAADVIYHEHLIVPLLDTLVLLTEPLSGLFTATGRPPLILISYVQRFKRAKQFVKAARRWFDVTIVSVSSVVDYDALNWNRGASELTVNSSSADWAGFPPLADGSRPVSCLAYHYILMRRAGK